MQDQEKLYDAQYPLKDFKKTTYQFSAQEVRNLTTFVTLTQMGKIAEVMANNFVSNEVIKRLGVQTTLDSGILYDVGLGTVITYTPKVVCSRCGEKKAEFSYKNNVYCKACVDIVTEEGKKPEERIEEPKKEEKKKKK